MTYETRSYDVIKSFKVNWREKKLHSRVSNLLTTSTPRNNSKTLVRRWMSNVRILIYFPAKITNMPVRGIYEGT